MKTTGSSLATYLCRWLGALLLLALPVAASAKVKPVGIALEIDNGEGVPVQLEAGGTFYVDQLDMRASLHATTDSDVSGLEYEGDFAELPWHGIRQADQEFALLANGDGTFTRRRFFTEAQWMELPSFFIVEQVDARGRPHKAPLILNAGIDDARLPGDGFFIRRMRAIQWTYDCASLTDCSSATNFEEEALVELRNARGKPQTFKLHPQTTALRVTWSLKPWQRYEIPVLQVKKPKWDYGFKIAIDPVTPAQADGTYAPGTDITFRVTLQDGNGKRLHPEGSLPTYAEAVLGTHEAGINYYRAFFDATTTYYRRKHRERMMMAQIIGPAQDIQAIRSIADLDLFLAPGVQTVGTMERDGVYAQFTTFPQSSDLFGGAFDPVNAGWFAHVPDTFTFSLPGDAKAGTYLLTLKGRRTFLGQDIPATTTIEVQVGSPVRTHPHLTTGKCESCHNNGGELHTVLHANANRAACAGCHVPLGFELEGPIYVRTHFIHSRSDRFAASEMKCTTCHLEQETTQRVSKSACLSCHNSYPEWHENVFGPIESMYVGGGRDSFVSCTDSCHQTHPNSGF